MCACVRARVCACLRAVDSERLNVTARQQSLRGEQREKCCKGRKGDDSFLMKVYQAVKEKKKNNVGAHKFLRIDLNIRCILMHDIVKRRK